MEENKTKNINNLQRSCVKNKLFFESNWPKYKIYRNKLTTLIRLSKQRHYQMFFDSNIKKYTIDMERYYRNIGRCEEKEKIEKNYLHLF